MLRKAWHILWTLRRLGWTNVVTVLLYRASRRLGWIERRLPQGQSCSLLILPTSPGVLPQSPALPIINHSCDELLRGRLPYFSCHKFLVGSPPDWFFNPLIGKKTTLNHHHWSQLSDFDTGDIKGIWEASRFDWVLTLACGFRQTNDVRYWETFNNWLLDWTKRNPLNTGPNWKCGQEVAIRLLQLLLATKLLQHHHSPTSGLRQFVVEHCSRIEPTIRYAMAQDNNHGTSEAAALFVGGAWLLAVSKNEKKQPHGPERWLRLGRRWLENRVAKLVEPDGSFSQYSLNYHRLFVDTINMVEWWRQELDLPAFSDRFHARSRAAVSWLFQMVDPATGDGPNVGANDGARLFVLSITSYRDYRPTIQLGTVLFFGKTAYGEGTWDEPLVWLDVDKHRAETSDALARQSRVFKNGGYVVLHAQSQSGTASSWGVVRFPRFRFRPSHADALHFDLWLNGINLLRDSGSYSYNTEEPWQSYFSSTEAHNTIQFDDLDQMPRLSRFLYGSWLQADHVGEIVETGPGRSWTGSYRDSRGCRHRRTVNVQGMVWRVTDEIDGFQHKAVLRWRLIPGSWRLEGTECHGDLAVLSFECNVEIKRCILVKGWESRYYMEKTELPVLEVEVGPDRAVLTTTIKLKAGSVK